MKEILLIFLGGGAGSIARYCLGKWINSFHNFAFPYSTLGVNILACFILGIVVALADEKQLLSPAMRLLLAVGFCGGFSTFSTFSIESLELLQNGNLFTSFSYILLSIVLCLVATFGGMFLVKIVA